MQTNPCFLLCAFYHNHAIQIITVTYLYLCSIGLMFNATKNIFTYYYTVFNIRTLALCQIHIQSIITIQGCMMKKLLSLCYGYRFIFRDDYRIYIFLPILTYSYCT